MRRIAWIAALAVLAAGCGHFAETRETHIVHSGEDAVVVHPAHELVCGALRQADVHALARAFDGGDEAAVKNLVAAGKAIELARNTRVHVMRESYNEREIRVQEGTHTGKVVWVPFEWLRPAG